MALPLQRHAYHPLSHAIFVGNRESAGRRLDKEPPECYSKATFCLDRAQSRAVYGITLNLH
jgi:hypothetical protein